MENLFCITFNSKNEKVTKAYEAYIEAKDALIGVLYEEGLEVEAREKTKTSLEMQSNKELNFEKIYYLKTENGSKVKLTINAEIKDLNKSDLREILHEVATSSRNFYLGLGNEISNKPL